MILVSSTRSSHTADEPWILTKPPAGISLSRNQLFPITGGVSCAGKRRGSYATVGIEGASYHMFLHMNLEPFLSIGLLTMSGWCIVFCLKGSVSFIHCAAALVSIQVSFHSISNFHPKWSQWSQAPSDTQLSGHVLFGCCPNAMLSPRTLTHLSVSRKIQFAPMRATTILTHPPTPHWKRLLFQISPSSQ